MPPDLPAVACLQNAWRLSLISIVFLATVVMARSGRPHEMAAQPTGSPARVAARLDPNTAPWWELAALPRMGESMGRRIVAHRATQRFQTIDDIDQISGIGPALLSQLRPYLAIMPVHEANGGH